MLCAAFLFVINNAFTKKSSEYLWFLFVIALMITATYLDFSSATLAHTGSKEFQGIVSIENIIRNSIDTIWMIAFVLLLAHKSHSIYECSFNARIKEAWRLHAIFMGGAFVICVFLTFITSENVTLAVGTLAIVFGWASAVYISNAANPLMMASAITWLSFFGLWMVMHLGQHTYKYDFGHLSTASLLLSQLALTWHIFVLLEKKATENYVRLEGTPSHWPSSEQTISNWPSSLNGNEEHKARQGEFLATMSHELRTPLSCIIAVSRMLSGDEQTSKLIRKDMGTVERLALQLLRTVDEGLAFVRQEPPKEVSTSQTVFMAHLLRDMKSVASWLAQQHRNSLVFLAVKNIPAQLCFDEQRVRQILINLISNATRYCQDGQITLGVAIREKAGKPHLEWLIEDTGCGMDIDEQKKFFAPFTKSRNSQGLGLGLALVKQLSSEIDGHVSLRSVKGQGTRFKVSIPVLFTDRDSVIQSELEQYEVDPESRTRIPSPIALLPNAEIQDLNLSKLRKIVKLGQLSEVESWIQKAYSLRNLSPESLRLLDRIKAAVAVVDLEEVLSLLDQVDTPLSFI